MDLSDLPPELVHDITQHLSLRDHARCLSVCKRFEACFSRLLYARLRPLKLSADGGTDSESFGTRRHVVRWACEHGITSTLRKVDEVEALNPFIKASRWPTDRVGFTNDRDPPKVDRGGSLRPVYFGLLHVASYRGQVEALHFLLGKGADVNTESECLPPWDYISLMAMQETAQLLLGAGADPNLRDAIGRTAWETAESRV